MISNYARLEILRKMELRSFDTIVGWKIQHTNVE
jgi:hypothetical protein